MTEIPAKEVIKELTLMLIYLTKFKDNNPYNIDFYSAWKGYDFGVLNELDKKDYIRQGKIKSKHFLVTDKGMEEARKLLEKYGIDDLKL